MRMLHSLTPSSNSNLGATLSTPVATNAALIPAALCNAPKSGQAISCGHEICARAKFKGITWWELDTIKYYDVRINAERTERKKNALRKQRDIELIKVKKEEDEEAAQKARRTSSTDKKKPPGGSSNAFDEISDQALLDVLLGGSNASDSSDPQKQRHIESGERE